MTNNQPAGIGYEKNVHWFILSEVIFFAVNIKYIQKLIKDFKQNYKLKNIDLLCCQ